MVFSGMTLMRRSSGCCVYFLTIKNVQHDERVGFLPGSKIHNNLGSGVQLSNFPISAPQIHSVRASDSL